MSCCVDVMDKRRPEQQAALKNSGSERLREFAVKVGRTAEDVAGYDRDQLLDYLRRRNRYSCCEGEEEKTAVTQLQSRESELALREAERNDRLKREEVERVDRLKREESERKLKEQELILKGKK